MSVGLWCGWGGCTGTLGAPRGAPGDGLPPGDHASAGGDAGAGDPALGGDGDAPGPADGAGDPATGGDDASGACGAAPDGTIESRVRYQAASVPASSSCVSETQTRQCQNGTWSAWTGTFTFVTCVPEGGTGPCGNLAGQLFPPAAPWNTPVDGADVDAESDAIIDYLVANHTASGRFQITFDFNRLEADETVAHRSFNQTGDFFSPDCDPAPLPVPPGGRLESEDDYHCSTDGDCHLTVIDWPECRLYEMWRADIDTGAYDTGTFDGGCLAIWDLSQVPPSSGRGMDCTSADAAGLPILPLVFDADEVAAGEIKHALRFILPNNRIRHLVFVSPGTHSTGPTSGGATAPPYCVHLRLKAATDLSGLSPNARVIATALKTYGMYLADGGNITFTAATDALTTAKWSALGIDAHSLTSLSWADFEVVEMGTLYTWPTTRAGCSRTPIEN